MDGRKQTGKSRACFILAPDSTRQTKEALKTVLKTAHAGRLVETQPAMSGDAWKHLIKEIADHPFGLAALVTDAACPPAASGEISPFIASAVTLKDSEEEYLPDVPPPETLASWGIAAARVVAVPGGRPEAAGTAEHSRAAALMYYSGDDIFKFCSASSSILPPHRAMAAGLSTASGPVPEGECVSGHIESMNKLTGFIKHWSMLIPDARMARPQHEILETCREELWLTATMKREIELLLAVLLEKRGIGPGEFFSLPAVTKIMQSQDHAKRKGKHVILELKKLMVTR